MPSIRIASHNHVNLTGQVVGAPAFSKNANGVEECRLTLLTEKAVRVKGESKLLPSRHSVVIYHKMLVPAFKANLKEGYYIRVTGELSYEGQNQKAVVAVYDHGGDASFMYLPEDDGGERPQQQKSAPSPSQQQRPSPAPALKGGFGDMSRVSNKQKTYDDPDPDFDDRPARPSGGRQSQPMVAEDDIPF